MSNGKIIVIDGLDGSGKSTQLEITEKKLNEMGYNVRTISFPDYDSQSSALVKMYLNGEFSSNPNDINAYAASSFYAVDRFASYELYWERSDKSGSIILASRYNTSNAIHQMGKLPREQWDDYLFWLEDYEYGKLGLPKPDLVIFLSLPLSASQKLLMNRYDGDDSKKDIHESDLEYLHECIVSAEYAAEKMGWKVIDCFKDGKIRDIEDINSELLKIVKEVLD